MTASQADRCEWSSWYTCLHENSNRSHAPLNDIFNDLGREENRSLSSRKSSSAEISARCSVCPDAAKLPAPTISASCRAAQLPGASLDPGAESITTEIGLAMPTISTQSVPDLMVQENAVSGGMEPTAAFESDRSMAEHACDSPCSVRVMIDKPSLPANGLKEMRGQQHLVNNNSEILIVCPLLDSAPVQTQPEDQRDVIDRACSSSDFPAAGMDAAWAANAEALPAVNSAALNGAAANSVDGAAANSANEEAPCCSHAMTQDPTQPRPDQAPDAASECASCLVIWCPHVSDMESPAKPDGCAAGSIQAPALTVVEESADVTLGETTSVHHDSLPDLTFTHLSPTSATLFCLDPMPSTGADACTDVKTDVENNVAAESELCMKPDCENFPAESEVQSESDLDFLSIPCHTEQASTSVASTASSEPDHCILSRVPSESAEGTKCTEKRDDDTNNLALDAGTPSALFTSIITNEPVLQASNSAVHTFDNEVMSMNAKREEDSISDTTQRAFPESARADLAAKALDFHQKTSFEVTGSIIKASESSQASEGEEVGKFLTHDLCAPVGADTLSSNRVCLSEKSTLLLGESSAIVIDDGFTDRQIVPGGHTPEDEVILISSGDERDKPANPTGNLKRSPKGSNEPIAEKQPSRAFIPPTRQMKKSSKKQNRSQIRNKPVRRKARYSKQDHGCDGAPGISSADSASDSESVSSLAHNAMKKGRSKRRDFKRSLRNPVVDGTSAAARNSKSGAPQPEDKGCSGGQPAPVVISLLDSDPEDSPASGRAEGRLESQGIQQGRHEIESRALRPRGPTRCFSDRHAGRNEPSSQEHERNDPYQPAMPSEGSGRCLDPGPHDVTGEAHADGSTMGSAEDNCRLCVTSRVHNLEKAVASATETGGGRKREGGSELCERQQQLKNSMSRQADSHDRDTNTCDVQESRSIGGSRKSPCHGLPPPDETGETRCLRPRLPVVAAKKTPPNPSPSPAVTAKAPPPRDLPSKRPKPAPSPAAAAVPVSRPPIGRWASICWECRQETAATEQHVLLQACAPPAAPVVRAIFFSSRAIRLPHLSFPEDDERSALIARRCCPF